MRSQVVKGLCIAAVLACGAGPVCAQSNSKGVPDAPPKTQQQIDQERQIEKAYKESLKSIPDAKGSNDPWNNVRGTDADVTPVKPAKPKPKPAKPAAANGATAAASPWPAQRQSSPWPATQSAPPWPAPH
ncbi:MAG: hypothetical protein P4M07_08510 [Xanthobacteraceae bacterium]|nr:hypothetical protein [Xanthobacteraceae bacterium]